MHIKDNRAIQYRVDKDEVNGRVNIMNFRDANIYKVVKLYPGLRVPQLLELIKPLDPAINKNILYKRIKLLSEYIEFRGTSKTGGYYIKVSMNDS